MADRLIAPIGATDERSVGQPRSGASGYRVVVIDIDGTLLPHGGSVSERNRLAIERAIAAGIVVTLASGRMFPLIEPLVKELGLTAPTICYGGALIVDPSTGRSLQQRGVPRQLAIEVIRAARDRGLTARVYLDAAVYVDAIDAEAFNYDSLTRVAATAVGDLERFLEVDATHLAIDAPPGMTRGLVHELQEQFGGRLNVTTGHPLLTEFSHLSVHKGSALAWLCEHMGQPLAASIAIGNDWNDLAMLRSAGLAIAVSNAHPDVLAIADVVVPSVDNCGVAHALERFVL
jgi:Cof subfamily protein (haloacid dehalogenase superfamily)